MDNTLLTLIQLSVPLLCVVLLMIWYIYTFFITLNTAPYFPSRIHKLKAAFEYINLGNQDNFLDVGCGDGRVVLAASKYAATATGIDLNPFLTLLCRISFFLHRRHNTYVYQTDMFKFDYSKYNVIYLYLLIKSTDKLLATIKHTAKPGTILISNQFKINSLQPIHTIGDVYIYKL